jgi:hypothetical protein
MIQGNTEDSGRISTSSGKKAVEHHLDQVKAAAAGQGEYPSVRDTEALFRNRLLEQKAKGKLSD